MTDDPLDLVASVGDLDPVVETLRVFLHDSGALRAVAVVAGEPPAVVDVGRLAPIEVTTQQTIVHMPHAIELDAEPLTRPRVHQIPPFEVSGEDATVIGTMGGLDMIGDALLELARAFGDGAVALAEFATTNSQLPMTVSARVGEAVLVSIGEEQFEIPD
ncbi:MAG TPA: hypothetical protein VNT22_02460 [Baekduia sp.]|nr:hypothetical protein [Baekduia sp.]